MQHRNLIKFMTFSLLLFSYNRCSVVMQVLFDRQLAIRLSGMSEKAYIRSFNVMQNGIGIKNKLDVRELAIQFGCVRLIPSVQKGLSLYRERFIASLPPSRRASADFTRPVFTATGFYLCAKKHKLKVDKNKLIELSEETKQAQLNFLKRVPGTEVGV
ncbi:hypothetical protein L1987_79420 [Smallanthus sonchifolius]|uniref:Uncharacterized protein n=1 Tax=Smallanthus sonchifolius TaxID=185202 RepID=A0ACB8ZFY9_9ASTR|nr:hypothetical protein L1987_79420 [Smallanthus sonchifolius]